MGSLPVEAPSGGGAIPATRLTPGCCILTAMIRLALLAVALSACQLVPGAPAIDCGSVPPRQCTAMVEDLLQQAREEFPDKRVASVRLSTPTGGYDVLFTDGTGFAVTE